jgi:LmbE family N-acetylglucosaminyl deacetylase
VRTVLSVAPHPDDELLGAPATLMALRDAGWRVINLACSLGRSADQGRRREELVKACRRAGFELAIPDGLAPIGRGDDLALAQGALSAAIVDQLGRVPAELIVGPSPHDGHHGHEVVGRAIRDAVEARGLPFRVLLWGLWSELPIPNLLVPFGADRLAEIQRALSSHAGELERNRFDRLLAGRAAAGAVLGPERVFGFGASGAAELEYAELLSAVSCDPGRGWRLAPAREFDPLQPLADGEGVDIGWWLHAVSVRSVVEGRGVRGD